MLSDWLTSINERNCFLLLERDSSVGQLDRQRSLINLFQKPGPKGAVHLDPAANNFFRKLGFNPLHLPFVV